MEQQEADKKMIADLQNILSTMDEQGQLKRQSGDSDAKAQVGKKILDRKTSQNELIGIIIFIIAMFAGAILMFKSLFPAQTALPQPIPAGQQYRS